MKIYFSVIITILFFTACNNTKYDGMYCKTDKGNIIILKHNIGDTYFVRDVNISKVQKINNFINSKELNNERR